MGVRLSPASPDATAPSRPGGAPQERDSDEPPLGPPRLMLRPVPVPESAAGYRGATWNAQGFFACDLHRQHAKRRLLHSLLRGHDFVGLQETHTTEGSSAGVQLPDGVVSLWSHGTRRQGGVALLVQAAFLCRCSPVAREDWEEILLGRLVVLHLRGLGGALSVAVA